MRVRWLRRALENLNEEATYIAKDNPRIASEFVHHLHASAAMLADQPNMGRPGRIAGTRELVVPVSLISYRTGFAVVPLKFCGYSIPQENGHNEWVDALRSH